MKRNIKVFNYSFILRTIGLGMFNTLFNIYILENSNFSNAFLEKFLAIGNFSMAVSSYFIGFTIDRYNKKKLMLFFSIQLYTLLEKLVVFLVFSSLPQNLKNI